MKKFLFGSIALIAGVLFMNNVYAEEACTAANAGDLSTNLSNSDCTTINLKSGTTYTDNFTITHDVTIVGNGATIEGTIAITGGTNINISDLTMTGGTSNDQAKPEYISVQSANVKLNVSKVKIYYSNMDNSSEFIKHGTGIVVYDPTGEGSTVEVTDSTIHTKYAIWIEGSNSNLTVKNSELSGYAALDLTSSDNTNTNNITIDHSTLTGYAIETGGDNDYGTIVIRNKDNVKINIINNSVITNNFANGTARSDLILISNYKNQLSKNVNVNVSNSTLNNTAKDNKTGVVYNANNSTDNTFKTQNTIVTGPLFVNSENHFVDFVIDGKSNIVEATKEGKLDQSAIPNPKKNGYEFAGWYLEDTYKNVFDTTSNITEDMIVYAKFTKVKNSNVLDDVPKTGMLFGINYTKYLVK